MLFHVNTGSARLGQVISVYVRLCQCKSGYVGYGQVSEG
jgi:hypothetical protein